MAVQQRASGMFARIQSLVDKLVSPSKREQYWNSTTTFAQEQPLLFTFLAAQLLLSFTPLALFLSFVLGTLALSLITALLFSLFWIGIALLVLIPTLFVTVSLGIVVWIWAVSSFVIVRWIYNSIPISVKGNTEVALPSGKKVVVNKSGEGYGDVKGEIRNGD